MIATKKPEATAADAANETSGCLHREQAVLEAFPDPAYIKDYDGRYLAVNQALCTLIGKDQEQLLGRNAYDLFPKEIADQLHRQDQQVLSTGVPHRFEERTVYEGKDRWFDATKSPYFDSQGKQLGLIGIAREVTESKFVQLKEREAMHRLETLENVSHAIASTLDVEAMISKVIEVVFSSFGCDRAWLLYPCDPTAEFWHIRYETTRTEYPGALFLKQDFPVEETVRENFRQHLITSEPIAWGFGGRPHPWVGRDKFDIRSQLSITVKPRFGKPWLLGMHQCSRDRTWSTNETALFKEVAYRLADALSLVLLVSDLKAARAEAEKVSLAKDVFLATLSHELRTPLTSILTWAQLLKTGRLDTDRTRQGIGSIETAARTQGQLIDDLLDISRIILGKLTLSVQDFDPRSVIRSVTETVGPMMSEKRLDIALELSDDVQSISADPARLQQILWNLLNNAAKFTPKGGSIRIKLLPAKSGYAKIVVSDTGMGIPPEFLSHIFDRFSQADGTATRTSGGLGLGLAIVRQLVELQNGFVMAESSGPDKGATFTVHLPSRKQASPAKSPLPRIPETPRDLSMALLGIRVLLVEDDPGTREALQILLRSFGAEVCGRACATEALSAFAAFRPHVIISDIAIPEQDGFSFLRQLRLLEPHSSVPVIALTAYAGDDHRMACLSAGFAAHLCKPIESTQLVQEIIRLGGLKL